MDNLVANMVDSSLNTNRWWLWWYGRGAEVYPPV